MKFQLTDFQLIVVQVILLYKIGLQMNRTYCPFGENIVIFRFSWAAKYFYRHSIHHLLRKTSLIHTSQISHITYNIFIYHLYSKDIVEKLKTGFEC